MIPGLPVIWVVVFVLLLALLLDRLLFKPLTRVMAERETRVKSAIELAREASERARAATADFTERTTSAQAEVYRQMDETRRIAMERRHEVLAATRSEVETLVGNARSRIEEQAKAARVGLERDADALAKEVASRVLGRSVQ